MSVSNEDLLEELTAASIENLGPRFWAKVDWDGDCWLWTAFRRPTGYGLFAFDGKTQSVHRLTFAEANGPIPDGLVIDHMCHNTGCLRPSHLRLTTAKQNGENRLGAHRCNKSGIRGVLWEKKAQKWSASVRHNGKLYRVGYYVNIEDAAAAAKAKRLELFTHNDADRWVA